MRKLVVGLVVLAIVLVAADFGARLYSESVVGKELRSSLDLNETPSVSFGGWPFIPHLVSGELPSATFTADRFSASGLQLRRVTVVLDDVRFPTSRLVSGGGGVIHAKRGHGTAVLTARDATAALRAAGIAAVDVRIEDGHASVGVGGLRVGLKVTLEGGALVFAPAAVSVASTRVALPTIVKGLRYTNLELGDDEAVLSFQLSKAAFVIPPS